MPLHPATAHAAPGDWAGRNAAIPTASASATATSAPGPDAVAVTTITLGHATDWAGFRAAARTLLHSGCAPQQVQWFTKADAAQDLFADAPDGSSPPASERPAADGATPPPEAPGPPETPDTPAHPPTARVPREFLQQCERVVLHRDPGRFALMYRLLWRLAHEPGLRHDPLDPDRLRLQHLERAVKRDMHKMRAFVRFRPVTEPDGGTLHIAWFEPDHWITEANAPFFARRFTQMRWAILTPDASVHWDGKALHRGPAAQRSDAPPPDAGEALWLTYYRNIFNPARLKLDMMRKEMPTRYWKNLPEATLIGELAQTAHARSTRMVEAPGTLPRRRIAGAGRAATEPPE
ncbi:TIGR03915 family putative DNA repair protein [Acidovorax sp. NCPPB 3576]|uniref:TIGR03915 family putative DNA repair protein n=1 Tax=Acidovorax sp. NCPPB 3576 TaxID=2940488 RepID=UPI00234BCCB7|nr:TIGR03915 family putative DNA repair protein [Acidovorax sp. NCPPB 3576]WCM88724.1 TIGR03915 family putative DNA repair protein [Acidovorax sp. NCPPB 3576]